MQKNKYIIGALVAIAIMSASAFSAFAATNADGSTAATKVGNAPTADMQAKFEEMKAEQEKIMAAAVAGNYDTWYALMTADGKSPKILTVINKDNFAQFSKAQQLMEESKQILTDLGVDKIGRHVFGGGFGGRGPGEHGRHGVTNTVSE